MRKKKQEEHVNLERWLVSYADFITLLFAFFVVMYAISQADLEKFKQVSESLRQAFGGGSQGPAGMIDIGGSGGGRTLSPFPVIEGSGGGRVMNLPAGKTHTASDPKEGLRSAFEKLEETISVEIGATALSDELQMVFDQKALVVRIATKDFFSPGEVAVASDLRPLLDKIGAVVMKTSLLVRIEGHADPSEASLPNVKSTLDLSMQRAAWVMNYWLKRFPIAPKRLSAAGYAHYRPLTRDRSKWGKAANRRVEIIFLGTQYRK